MLSKFSNAQFDTFHWSLAPGASQTRPLFLLQRLQPCHSPTWRLNLDRFKHWFRRFRHWSFTVWSVRIWPRNSVWIRCAIVMIVQLKSDRMTSSKCVQWVQKCGKGLEKNSQKHLGESRNTSQTMKFIEGPCRKPSEWLDQSPHPKHLLPEQRHIRLNDLNILFAVQHDVAVNILTDRVRSSSRSNKPPDSCLKGRYRTETCLSHLIGTKNSWQTQYDKILQQLEWPPFLWNSIHTSTIQYQRGVEFCGNKQ